MRYSWRGEGTETLDASLIVPVPTHTTVTGVTGKLGLEFVNLQRRTRSQEHTGRAMAGMAQRRAMMNFMVNDRLIGDSMLTRLTEL
jgi:hypothetical protein